MWIWIGVGVVLVILMVVYGRRPRGWNGKWKDTVRPEIIIIDGLNFTAIGASSETKFVMTETADPKIRNMVGAGTLTLKSDNEIIGREGNGTYIWRRI